MNAPSPLRPSSSAVLPFNSAPAVGVARERAEKIRRGLGAADTPLLKAERIQNQLKKLPGWAPSPTERGLERTYFFASRRAVRAFRQALDRVTEEAGYLPEAAYDDQHVRVRVATSPTAGVTELDFEVVALIEGR